MPKLVFKHLAHTFCFLYFYGFHSLSLYHFMMNTDFVGHGT